MYPIKKRILLIAVAIALLGGGIVYWKFRGAFPALLPPRQPVTELITFSSPFKLPRGFSISVFAEGLGAPRVMAYDSIGNILVSVPSEGKVVAVRDTDGDGRADRVITVAEGLKRPHGIAMRCKTIRESEPGPCKLYIAESDGVAVYDYDEAALKARNGKRIINLPDTGGHSTRTILFMPYPDDRKLLISVGSSCNVCNETDWRRAKILVANEDGSDLKTFSSGLRNAVFMTIHPVDGKIWVTEMGRDFLGDDVPPDEINVLKEGGDFGWPICYGKNIHDTDFDKNIYIRDPCTDKIPSHIDLPAHSAPLGLSFIPEEGWPQQYWYNLLVAYHGSWNRTTPTGYKIARFVLDESGNYRGVEDFVTGWLTEKSEVLGRPVDILVQPGGTMYVSDDKAGVIYRIIYHEETAEEMILVRTPRAGDLVKNPLTVEREAKGYWFFEAGFPVKLFDANGSEIAVNIGQVLGNWMTTDFVPFRATLEFTSPKTKEGKLILRNDNPSGLPEFEKSVSIPLKFPPLK